MSKRIGLAIFMGCGLFLALALAAFVSPHASSAPDGLERVAEDKGFIDKAEGAEVWRHAPAPDYTVPGVKDEGVSTALAGVLGTLAVFGAAIGVALLLRKRPEKPDSRTMREPEK